MINKTLKIVIPWFIFIVIIFDAGFAQNEDCYKIDKSDWKVFEEQNGVVFSQKIIEYHDDINDQHKEFYLVRILNTTDQDMEIHAKKTIWYDDKCFNCDSDSDEYTFDIQLGASEEITGDPVNNRYDNLVIFKKFLKYPDIKEVTDFEFQDLTIKLN